MTAEPVVERRRIRVRAAINTNPRLDTVRIDIVTVRVCNSICALESVLGFTDRFDSRVGVICRCGVAVLEVGLQDGSSPLVILSRRLPIQRVSDCDDLTVITVVFSCRRVVVRVGDCLDSTARIDG